MTRGVSMTEKQKLICIAHESMFSEDIIKLDGMAGVSKRQVRDYLHLVAQHPEGRQLAERIEAYIEQNGLPKEFAAVIGYIRYLKTVVES